jgi:hypothetical protein
MPCVHRPAIYINKINSGHLDLRVPRQIETNIFSHKLLITDNELWKKKYINYFRKKGTKMFLFPSRKARNK